MSSQVAELRVGLIDSGVAAGDAAHLLASRGFARGPAGVAVATAAVADTLGHGATLARLLLSRPGLRLASAQVFTQRLSCTAAQVVAALEWLLQLEVRVVNLSFGLRRDDPDLAEVCARAVAAGVVLVAAAPARGAAVYPASYPGVIRATGDARCAVDDISWLATAQADFGAHVRCDTSALAGASIACARLTAVIADCLRDCPEASSEQLHATLVSRSRFRGPERRR